MEEYAMRPLARWCHRVMPVAALAVVLALGALGCNEVQTGGGTIPMGVIDSSPSTGPSVSSTEAPTTSTTAPPVSTVATVPLASSESLLPNGHIKACGLIKEVW